MSRPPLVILGCGFTGTEVAKRALATGRPVIGTTRQADRISALAKLGIDARWVPQLTGEQVQKIVGAEAQVLIALPPDGQTDGEIASALGGASHIVYISTTGVFGAARGRVDEATPVDPTEPSAKRRLAAEERYLSLGATVLRPAGIYGPGRGLHRRLMDGQFRVPGAGINVVSRIHVADLTAIAMAVLDGERPRARGRVFVVADDAPVPQIEVIGWLCRRLDLPLPPFAPLEEVASTLRHDRAVDNARVKRELSLSLMFPTYREGFEACLIAEGVSRAD